VKHEAASCTVGVPRESPAHRRLELLAKMSFYEFSQPGMSKLPPGPCRLGNRHPPGTAVSCACFLPTQGGYLQVRPYPMGWRSGVRPPDGLMLIREDPRGRGHKGLTRPGPARHAPRTR
jgi:hypothetical protein